jgi:hypothetical protein
MATFVTGPAIIKSTETTIMNTATQTALEKLHLQNLLTYNFVRHREKRM